MFNRAPSAPGIKFNNETNGFTSTLVQDAIEEARGSLINYSATATANTSTSSGTDSVISGMTITPAAGTYIVLYSGQISTSGTNNYGEISIWVDGNRISHSVRDVGINVSLLLGLIGTSTVTAGANNTMAIVTVDGTTAITAQFKVLNGSGTLTVGPRSIVTLKIG